METDNEQKTLYLEIRNVYPAEYLKELRLALIHLLRLHFEGPESETTEEERFALYRITDFLAMITQGDLIPIEFKRRSHE